MLQNIQNFIQILICAHGLDIVDNREVRDCYWKCSQRRPLNAGISQCDVAQRLESGSFKEISGEETRGACFSQGMVDKNIQRFEVYERGFEPVAVEEVSKDG